MVPGLRIHAFEPASRANGPGLRAVVWVQGCTLNCPGCFNPKTHDPNGGSLISVEQLAQQILAQRERIEGLTISGGEPFQQPEGLFDLLDLLANSGLSCLLFTGYTREEVQKHPLGPQILKHVDVLISGRYMASQHLGQSLLGSANQQIHLLTNRYKAEEFACIPSREIILHSDGTVTLSGIAPW